MNTQLKHGFAERIETIQKSDRQGRRLNSSMFDFVEFLYQKASICPIKSFNWLCSITAQKHTHAGKTFIEFIIPENLYPTHGHLIYFFKNAAIGMWAIRHFQAEAVFMKTGAKVVCWCYPIEMIREIPPDDSIGQTIQKKSQWNDQAVLI